MAEVYRHKVAELEIALNDETIKAEAGEVLRFLIDRGVLTHRTVSRCRFTAILRPSCNRGTAGTNKVSRPLEWPRVYWRWLRRRETTDS